MSKANNETEVNDFDMEKVIIDDDGTESDEDSDYEKSQKETESDASTDENQTDDEDSEDEEDESEEESDEDESDDEDSEDDAEDESTDDDSEETTEEDETTTEEVAKGKLPNETPVEYARRLEIENLRRELREARGEKIFGKKPAAKGASVMEDPEVKKTLKKYDPKQVANLEELVDIIAKKKGLVTKEELVAEQYNEVANQELSSFLESEPDYESNPELWQRFQDEIALYKSPEDPKKWAKIFTRIHEEFVEEGLVTQKKKAVKDIESEEDPAKELRKAKAKNTKVKVVSHSTKTSGGDTPTTKTKSKSSLDSSIRSELKGFSAEDLEDL